MFLAILLAIFVLVVFVSALYDAMTNPLAKESELHARDRYAVAEMIEKELKEKSLLKARD
ncbi:MAG TPA: hypothetical protein VGK10_00555 [Prolixibacteraceae bacterium]|jgi:hypothetical protein